MSPRHCRFPSLTSNTSWRGMLISLPPFLLPRFKHELEGHVDLVTTFSPPLLLSLLIPVATHSPPSLQVQVGGALYIHHLFPLPHFKCESEGMLILSPPFPLPRFNASWRGVLSLHPPPTHLKCELEMTELESDSSLVFTRYLHFK